MLRALGGYDMFRIFSAGKQDGFVHMERATECGGACFDHLGLTR
jgi:hypothetical protein